MPDLVLEKELHRLGYLRIAGIDEAGRGPLAGPVSVAAVILPQDFRHDRLNDSKKLTEKQRETIYEEITTDPGITWCSVHIDPATIDRLNILHATWKGMGDCFEKIGGGADFALIDGKPVPGFPGLNQAVVRGDGKSLSIAAASVIAKVERDRIMVKMGENYPEYGFHRHKGYGTRAHLEALRVHGPCEIHRRSFSPVAEAERDANS